VAANANPWRHAALRRQPVIQTNTIVGRGKTRRQGIVRRQRIVSADHLHLMLVRRLIATLQTGNMAVTTRFNAGHVNAAAHAHLMQSAELVNNDFGPGWFARGCPTPLRKNRAPTSAYRNVAARRRHASLPDPQLVVRITQYSALRTIRQTRLPSHERSSSTGVELSNNAKLPNVHADAILPSVTHFQDAKYGYDP
jgi:hypothetical protein